MALIQYIFIQKTIILKKKQNILTDERIKLTNELIEGVELVKMYSWEDSLYEKIVEIRKKEIEALLGELCVLYLGTEFL